MIAPSSPPAELMDALKRKQLDVREHRSVITAMAEIMRHARQLRAGGTREPLVLLVVDRARVARADELVAACALYAPHAVAWTYDHLARPSLRSYHSAPPAAPTPEPAPAPPPSARQSPRIVISHSAPPSPQITVVRRHADPGLRLAGAGPVPEPKPAPRVEPSEDQPPALSDDELRMLLSDDWDPTKGMERRDR